MGTTTRRTPNGRDAHIATRTRIEPAKITAREREELRKLADRMAFALWGEVISRHFPGIVRETSDGYYWDMERNLLALRS